MCKHESEDYRPTVECSLPLEHEGVKYGIVRASTVSVMLYL